MHHKPKTSQQKKTKRGSVGRSDQARTSEGAPARRVSTSPRPEDGHDLTHERVPLLQGHASDDEGNQLRRERSPSRAPAQVAGGVSAAPTASSVRPAQRAEPGRLERTASTIHGQSREVIDAAVSLSVGQLRLVEGLREQLRALAELEHQVNAIERQIEASLPPAVPLDSLIAFQPQLTQLGEQGAPDVAALRATYRALSHPAAMSNLRDRLEQGLRPASQLDAHIQALSGDQRVAQVVSVNVLPPTRGNPAIAAQFAALNQAGGALPIAIEQSGDQGRIDQPALEQRARDSAVLVIDPARLAPADQISAQRQSEQGGGELGLDQVPAAAIVAVIVPASLGHLQLELPTHYVGAIESDVYYAGNRQNIAIQHPDYEAALRNLLAANPNKTLITHTTRLGPPKPLE